MWLIFSLNSKVDKNWKDFPHINSMDGNTVFDKNPMENARNGDKSINTRLYHRLFLINRLIFEVLPELRNNTRAFYRIVGSDSSEQHHRPSLRMSKRARIGYQDGFKSEEDVGVYTRVLTTDWLK